MKGLHKRQIKDLKDGEKGEKDCKDVLEKLFGMEFEKTSNFHNLDLVNERAKIYIEIKTRNIKHNQYPTLFFSYPKYKYINRNPDYKYYFVYNCKDGKYLYEYNKDDIIIGKGGRTDRGRNEYGRICNIPASLLKKINED